MFQAATKGIQPLHTNEHFVGGFCEFWCLPVENCASFPRVNAATQYLVGEPALIPGAAWFGPIEVPRDRLGFVEEYKKSKAGHYYTTKVEGVHVGDSPESRVNLENMPYHKYLVVGKVRFGGFYLLIGTPDSPLRFDGQFRSGNSSLETAQTVVSFIHDHISKAYVLPAFNADVLNPGAGGGAGGANMVEPEIITFVNTPIINIPWTGTRLDRFGVYPIVQVWLEEAGQPPFLHFGGSIEVDAPPPAFTELNVKLGGNPSGFIVLK